MESKANTFVVLGATGGIGSELCRRLARDGANPVLAARDEGRLEDLAGEIEAPYHAVDATDGRAVDGLFSRVKEEHGPIAGAVNCVGSFLLKPAHMTSDDEFAHQITANLTTAFNTVKAAARHMPGGGSVVLLSSVAARVGLANHEAVAAAKAGVSGLALSASASYVGRGLRFNVVSPGLVQTPMTENVTRSETARKASLDLHPLGRLGEPEDIAAAIAYLLGPDSGWVTGQTIGVDGGLSTLRPPTRRPAKA
ncbi:MAG: 3-oxoacyl-[acyl-carrier protein] reductase [uncultured Rubrobacteraceae bacterium]|uniref:3-oxoacyl-[acyl-carrier protein] reductase n=1 Tax=uncultured Rubrobacteraceae bacterium TaxID=349277 RepID=A0A6J4Q2B7_9ACTN|nr:MAG: 3-oxoacyl-[acyl-carrier protein] reductase [uncultured Rubrobacteraceae bacterium]